MGINLGSIMGNRNGEVVNALNLQKNQILDLTKKKPGLEKVIVITIHEAQVKRQTFGMVENSYIRLLDAKNNEKEVCRFNLKEDVLQVLQ